MNTQPTFTKPWFRVVSVHEKMGTSMADIAMDVARDCGIRLADMRTNCRRKHVVRARWEAYRRIRTERPDLSSAQIAMFFGVEGSSVRHALITQARAA